MKNLFYAAVIIVMLMAGVFVLLFVSFTSCSNREDEPVEMTVDVSDIILSTLWVDVDWPPQSQRINVSGTRQVSFTSENERIAKVTPKGEVLGMCAGITYVIVQGDTKSIKVKVTVIPRSPEFMEPLHDFNLTKKELIRQKGDGYELQTDLNVFYYRHGGTEPTGEYYFFNEETGLLSASYSVVDRKKMTEEKLYTFFVERYWGLGKGKWASLDGNLAVQISEYDKDHYKIMYCKSNK
ncbi:hypothetical protein [uncultured Bacteroides sp.]|uniref:hypothetical protein n=1 Tax=uncultured Bacteroides sp. TaxID=162156 RepID=UPI0026743E2E|nr:hypothetical protein [uncultured Bacteroides sp.]